MLLVRYRTLTCLFLVLVVSTFACGQTAAIATLPSATLSPAGTMTSSATFAPSLDSTVGPLPAGTQQTIWVDPQNGDDGNSGASRDQALQRLASAWDRIPQGSPLTVGYRILLVAGNYPEENLPNYMESRYGTAQAPISIQAADGRGTATLNGDLNIFDTRYLWLIDFNIVPVPAGDTFHCELCDHVWLQGLTLSGGDRQAHETVKVNQSQYIFIEHSDISGAEDNAIDFVAVQYGHIQDSRIHNAQDWCLYVKGGSAYIRVERNEIYDCGTGGFTAGQGTGFEFMTSPWLHYEAYDIKFVNNLIHDTEGAGMGVNGGYNILLAYNTLYRVGQRSHLIEVVFGARSCDGNPTACQERLNSGGWGTANVGGEGEPIPDQNIFIYNNVVYNPAGYQSQWQQFAIYGPRTPAGDSNIPSPARTDVNLQIRGNILWNGPADHPLGVGDDQGCRPENPTCNESQLRAENAINTLEPQLVDPAGGNFRPLPNGNLFTALTFVIPNFSWDDAPTPPTVPAGDPSNLVTSDYENQARPETSPPGAYAAPFTPTSWLFLPLHLKAIG